MSHPVPTLVVCGARGQLGRALAELPAPQGWGSLLLAKPEFDVTDPLSVDAALEKVTRGAVVNATAYTAVDKAETESELAYAVNRGGARHVALAAARNDLPVIHVSTDFVFDGQKKTAYVEEDPTAPLSVYGASKLAGEQALAGANPRHVILRTAWVFSRHGACFPRAIYKALRSRPEVSVVDDQIGCPTAAEHLAEIITAIAPQLLDRAQDDPLFGLYHLAGQPVLSRHDFARAIEAEMRKQGLDAGRVVPRKTDPDAPGARRPANSALSSERFTAAFGMDAPDWRAILPDCVAAYGESA
ncbi:MAG TPA: dTDP-4-dehydrorhamnose reductase [Magnetospirillaceae bacterium]|nr:dTDP-4-dehydrorhamnose reductase [Magnetospirillaceae bacterium]